MRTVAIWLMLLIPIAVFGDEVSQQDVDKAIVAQGAEFTNSLYKAMNVELHKNVNAQIERQVGNLLKKGGDQQVKPLTALASIAATKVAVKATEKAIRIVVKAMTENNFKKKLILTFSRGIKERLLARSATPVDQMSALHAAIPKLSQMPGLMGQPLATELIRNTVRESANRAIASTLNGNDPLAVT